MSKKVSKNEAAPQAGDRKFSSLADLTPDPSNARKHNPRNVGMLVDSLHQVGAARSIVVDENGVVLAGNATIEAAAEAGIHRVKTVEADGSEIVAVVRRGLSKEQKTKLALYDNRVAELAEWNPEILAELTNTKEIEGMFSDKELAEILTQTGIEPKDATVEPEKAAECQQKWQVDTGQVFTIGRHIVMCGDCTSEVAVARLMGGRKADAVLSDPIYGQNQEGVTNDAPETFERIIRGAVKVLPISNGVVVAFQSPRTFTVWLDAVREQGQRFERLLWLYKAAQCTFPWRGWILTSESIVVSSVGKANWQDVHPYSHDCYYLPEVSGELDESIGWHGSVKPLSVVTDLMSRICAPKATVFDGFAGTGTTLIAGENTGRAVYCMDIDPACIAVVLERASRAFPHLKIEKVDQARAA